MDKSSQLMFALQSPIGLRFGATLAVEAERITFEMDVVLEKGTVCPFRMELTGQEDTVMGDVRIDRVLPKRQGSLPRFVAKVLQMPENDRKAYDGWRRDQATGGISRRMERDPESIRQQMSDQMRGSTDAEARVVLDKMNAKSIYKRKSSDRIEGDPFGLGNESADNTRTDQDEIRDRLRASAEKMPEVSTQEADTDKPTPTEPSPPPPAPKPAPESEWLRPTKPTQTSTANQDIGWLNTVDKSQSESTPPPQESPEKHRPTQATPAPAAQTSPAKPPPPRPIFQVDGTKQPLSITVTYVSQKSLTADHTAGLKSSVITILHAALETLYLPVQLHFALPDGSSFTCMGQTVARTSKGTAIALELDTKQRKTLSEAIER